MTTWVIVSCSGFTELRVRLGVHGTFDGKQVNGLRHCVYFPLESRRFI